MSDIEVANAGECPDFFELPVDGNACQKMWVFWTAPGTYQVGTFDGTTFKPETAALRSNFGNSSYAAQTFFNDPRGRRIQIAWMQGSNFPNSFWNQQMGIPTELTLRTTPDGLRLFFKPVEELSALRGTSLASTTTPNEGEYRYASETGLFDVDLTFKPGPTGKMDFAVNGTDILYIADNHELRTLDVISGKPVSVSIPPIAGVVHLRFFVDRASIEIFGQDGLIYMPFVTYPGHGTDQYLDLKAAGKEWRIQQMRVYAMLSGWPTSK